MPAAVGQSHIFDGPALDFTYLEGGYEYRSFDSSRLDDADGFGVSFSLAPIPILYLTGDFHYANPEDFIRGERIDFIDASLGIGARLTLLDTVSAYVEGGAAYGKLDIPGGYDSAGYYVEPGLKIGLFGRVEASIAGEFTQLSGETIFGGKAGLMFGITDHLGITIDGSISEVSDFVGVGLRIVW